MIDIRNARRKPLGTDSVAMGLIVQQTTRFVRMVVCEHCLSPSTVLVVGVLRCLGCNRRVSEREEPA